MNVLYLIPRLLFLPNGSHPSHLDRPAPAAGRVALPEVHLHTVAPGLGPAECAGCSWRPSLADRLDKHQPGKWWPSVGAVDALMMCARLSPNFFADDWCDCPKLFDDDWWRSEHVASVRIDPQAMPVPLVGRSLEAQNGWLLIFGGKSCRRPLSAYYPKLLQNS